MKNLFGLQFREELDTDIMDGVPFQSARVSIQQEQLLEKMEEEKAGLEQKANLPLILQIIMQIGLYIGGVCLLFFLVDVWKQSFQQALENKWFVLMAAAILGGIYLTLYLKQRQKKREAMKTAEETMLEERAQRLDWVSRQELGVPESAVHIDVIQTSYELEDGQEEVYDNENLSLFAYCQEDSLCFTNLVWVFKVPFSSIQKVVWVKEQQLFYQWNKEEPYNSKTYKPYRIKKNNAEQYIIRGYYSLRISEARGEFEVMVPEYDEKILFSLLPSEIPKEGF